MPAKRSVIAKTKTAKEQPGPAIARPGADPLTPLQDYSLLNLPELLVARDKNHVELMRKKNVVGTAVGYYLIRNSDPWPKSAHAAQPGHQKLPRTLGNSKARPYSWPCILVFVSQWETEDALPWTE